MFKLGHCHSVFSGQISYEESFGWRRQLLSLTCGKRISSCNEHRNRHTVVRIGRKKRVSWKNSDKCSHWRRVLISHYISCQCTCLHPHCQQCVMVETAKSAFQVETKRFRSWYVKLSDSPFYIYIFMWVLYLTGYLWFIPKKKIKVLLSPHQSNNVWLAFIVRTRTTKHGKHGSYDMVVR